jgi:hypothetical protein
MQNRSCMGKTGTVAVFIAMFMLSAIAPSFSQSEEAIAGTTTDAKDGEAQGKTDARGNALWFISGLCLPGVGMILPWVFSPVMPSDKLIGKSDEFVDAYRKAYIRKKKVGNFLWSLAGFGTASTIAIGALIALPPTKLGCGDVYISEGCSNAISPGCTVPSGAFGCGSLGLVPPEALALLAGP